MLAPWARNYMGIPFKNMGRDRKGADCWGLIVIVYKQEYNVQLPLYAEQAYESLNVRQVGEIIRDRKPGLLESFTEVNDPKQGDIVLLLGRGIPRHVGIYVGEELGHPYLLHTTSARGQSYCERLTAKNFEYADPTYYSRI